MSQFESGLFRQKERNDKIFGGRQMQVNSKGYICCPKCGKQTKTKVLPETELKRFPLYCPWCKKESIIDT